MEDLIVKFIDKVPVAAALLLTVWMFLRGGKSMNKEWTDTVTRIARERDKDHRDCTQAVKENTQILHKVATLIETRIEQSKGK